MNARRLVDEQANDEGLWFVASTMPEAYLQQELRRLHAAVEAEPTRAEIAGWVAKCVRREVPDCSIAGCGTPCAPGLDSIPETP